LTPARRVHIGCPTMRAAEIVRRGIRALRLIAICHTWRRAARGSHLAIEPMIRYPPTLFIAGPVERTPDCASIVDRTCDRGGDGHQQRVVIFDMSRVSWAMTPLSSSAAELKNCTQRVWSLERQRSADLLRGERVGSEDCPSEQTRGVGSPGPCKARAWPPYSRVSFARCADLPRGRQTIDSTMRSVPVGEQVLVAAANHPTSAMVAPLEPPIR